MENINTYLELALIALGSLSMLLLKWTRDDIKEMKADLKETNKKLENHGNRLTAIETGLHMFEWFQGRNSLPRAKDE